jgi:hypothetical protein
MVLSARTVSSRERRRLRPERVGRRQRSWALRQFPNFPFGLAAVLNLSQRRAGDEAHVQLRDAMGWILAFLQCTVKTPQDMRTYNTGMPCDEVSNALP